MKEYYHGRRKEYLEKLRGKCKQCGAEENLEFDHIDPKSKKFNIGHLLNTSKEKTIIELKKCQLLCKNCHDKKTRKNKDFKIRNPRLSANKFNADQIRLIKAEIVKGKSYREISEKFNISKFMIHKIKSGKHWKHI